jgi:Protein of unknown function (DUF4245)
MEILTDPTRPGKHSLSGRRQDGHVTEPESGGADEAGRPAPRRRGGTTRDVLLSLAVLLIPIVLIVALTRACTSIAAVDPSGAIDQARTGGLFVVAVPDGLDPGWRPVQAGYTVTDGIGTLRVGYLTPEDGAVQLVQTNEDPQAALPREFGADVQPTGAVDIGGVAWRGYQVRGHERALVLTTGTRTTIVQGQASDAELQTLAGSLS